MTNRQKFAEAFGYEIMWRDTGEPVPGHCKILIAESEQFDEWLNQEYEPPAQPEREDCDTCKHGYFGSAECNNCRVRYPSHWESREGGQDEQN